MHLAAGTDELYRAFAQGIQAGQNGMGMNDIRLQGGSSMQGQGQGMSNNGGMGNGNGNGNNAQGRSQGAQQGQGPSNDMRRQSASGSVNGGGAGNGNAGNNGGNGNGNGNSNGNNVSSNGNSNGAEIGSTTGLSPYGLDPSAFQSEVRFQVSVRPTSVLTFKLIVLLDLSDAFFSQPNLLSSDSPQRCRSLVRLRYTSGKYASGGGHPNV